MENAPLITNDAVVLGVLLAILALVFRTSSSTHPFWRRFYTIVPSLLLCYFLPSLLSPSVWWTGIAPSCTSSPRATCCRPAWCS